jgi:hypothetical protein
MASYMGTTTQIDRLAYAARWATYGGTVYIFCDYKAISISLLYAVATYVELQPLPG